MNIDNHVIESLEELEAFLHLVESGALGLEGVTGVALATTNTDGRPFVAVLGDKHQLCWAVGSHNTFTTTVKTSLETAQHVNTDFCASRCAKKR